jgi:hypothetical protein
MNIKRIIKEEIDDWEWTRGPINIDIREGDKIRVHNIGSYESFIQWLGRYSDNYIRGEFGEHITGVVYTIDEDILGLEIDRDDLVYFPIKDHLEDLKKTIGLDLLYELI